MKKIITDFDVKDTFKKELLFWIKFGRSFTLCLLDLAIISLESNRDDPRNKTKQKPLLEHDKKTKQKIIKRTKKFKKKIKE